MISSNSLRSILLILVPAVTRLRLTEGFLVDTDIIRRSNTCRQTRSSQLHSVSKIQTAVLDGSSLNALDLFLAAEGKTTGNASISKSNSNNAANGRHAYCSVVTAKFNNERVIGIIADPSTSSSSSSSSSSSASSSTETPLETVSIDNTVHVYKDSLATIPKSVSDEDAISTCIASIAGIHCAMHDPIRPNDKVVENVGGSSESFVSSVETLDEGAKKVVVVGGGDYASFIADGLAAMGAHVTQVSTNKMLRPRKQKNVSISAPSSGELDLGFATAIGKFNALVDTLSDEGRAGESMCIGIDNDWDDFGTVSGSECSSAVIMELQRQHNCKRYISTFSKAQKMVRDNGLIFGRNEANQYTKKIGNNPGQNQASNILPPKHFGSRTLQKLFDSRVLFKFKGKESSFIQGWSMKEYWELTSWPRDVTGAANVRFGFPVVDDLNSLFDSDDEENDDSLENMVSAPLMSANTPRSPRIPKDQSTKRENPYLFKITGMSDLSSEIIGEKKKCVMFLSSTSCRTCKYLTPQYTKLSKDYPDEDVVFAKTNAFSKKGKELSRVLGVDAVPAFVFFRDGQRFGKTLSITRIPSKKLDLALSLLSSGEKWDAKSINKLNG